jgi:hypothetical protein
MADPGGHRLFQFSTTVYNYAKSRDNDSQSPTYTTFKVVCALPVDQRWANFPQPAPGRVVQVSGDWIGYYKVDGAETLCIIASAISFVPASSAPTSVASPPVSTVPGKRRRRVLGAGQEETPLKEEPETPSTHPPNSPSRRPALDPPAAPSEGSQSDDGVSSSDDSDASGSDASDADDADDASDSDDSVYDTDSTPAARPKRTRSPSPLPHNKRSKNHP